MWGSVERVTRELRLLWIEPGRACFKTYLGFDAAPSEESFLHSEMHQEHIVQAAPERY